MSMSYSSPPAVGQQPTPMVPTMAYQQQTGPGAGQQPPYGGQAYQQGPVPGVPPLGMAYPSGMYGMPAARGFGGVAPGATYGTPAPRFDSRHAGMQYPMPPMQGGFNDPYGYEPYGYGGYYDPVMSARPFDGYEPGYGRDAYGRDVSRRDNYGRDSFHPEGYGPNGFGWDNYDNDAYGRDRRDGRYSNQLGSRSRYDDDYNYGGYGGQRNGRRPGTRRPRSRSPCC